MWLLLEDIIKFGLNVIIVRYLQQHVLDVLQLLLTHTPHALCLLQHTDVEPGTEDLQLLRSFTFAQQLFQLLLWVGLVYTYHAKLQP